MAKFCGILGFCKTEETKPGVWEDKKIEVHAHGDFIKNTVKLENSGGVNDNVNLNMSISIIASPYTMQNFQFIKYVKFNGTAWRVATIEMQYPRLILTLGGLYNG